MVRPHRPGDRAVSAPVNPNSTPRTGTTKTTRWRRHEGMPTVDRSSGRQRDGSSPSTDAALQSRRRSRRSDDRPGPAQGADDPAGSGQTAEVGDSRRCGRAGDPGATGVESVARQRPGRVLRHRAALPLLRASCGSISTTLGRRRCGVERGQEVRERSGRAREVRKSERSQRERASTAVVSTTRPRPVHPKRPITP